jgi:hypothetical protein
LGRKTGSYKFEKRQKELKKLKRRQDKLDRRQVKSEDDDQPMTDDESVGIEPEGALSQAAEQ